MFPQIIYQFIDCMINRFDLYQRIDKLNSKAYIIITRKREMGESACV